jgi:hypothetical protein
MEMSDIAALTPGEKRASDAILAAMDAIRNIEEDTNPDPKARRKLYYNTEELAQGVHVLQSFVKQHVLHRIDPQEWSDWWESQESVERPGQESLQRYLDGKEGE